MASVRNPASALFPTHFVLSQSAPAKESRPMIASAPPAGSFAPLRTTGMRGVALLVFGLWLMPILRAAESSEPARLAAKSLLLDVARAGSRLVAVGDRGHVLLSDDEGGTWRQVIVPTRA